MRSMLSMLLLLVMVAATPADLKIIGEARVAPYKLVKLQATGADDAALIWDIDKEDQIDLIENGSGMLFVGPPGEYKIKVRAIRFKDGKAAVVGLGR